MGNKNGGLTNPEKVREIKDKISLLFESVADRLEVERLFDTFGDLSFGQLNHIFESVTDRIFDESKGKKVIAKYAKVIKESKELPKAYAAYTSLVHHKGSVNESINNLYVNEAIKFTDGLNRKKYLEEKNNLAEVVKEAVRVSGEKYGELKECIDKSNPVYESIEFVTVNNRKATNLGEYVSHIDRIQKFINEGIEENVENEYSGKNPEEINEKINEILSENEEWLGKLFSDMLVEFAAYGDYEHLFENRLQACLNHLDEGIESSETVESKNQLQTMRKQLAEKKYNRETVIEDLVNLAELEQTLSE